MPNGMPIGEPKHQGINGSHIGDVTISNWAVSGNISGSQMDGTVVLHEPGQEIYKPPSCSSCGKPESALSVFHGQDREGLCSRCLVEMVRWWAAVKGGRSLENIQRVPCDGCGYPILKGHGTSIRWKSSYKFACDRCIDRIAEDLGGERFRKNILI